MTKLVHLALAAAALLSVIGALSSTAGAVTWHNSGDTTFQATTGTGTLSSTGTSLTCPGTVGHATGTVAATPAGGATWAAMTGTWTWGTCVLGVSGWTVDCDYTFTAQSQSGAVTSGAFDVTCGLYLVGNKLCHLGGTITGSYTNQSPPFTWGQLTFNTGGNLTTSNGPSGTCPLGSDDRVHLTEMNYALNIASGGPPPYHLGPIITRTA